MNNSITLSASDFDKLQELIKQPAKEPTEALKELVNKKNPDIVIDVGDLSDWITKEDALK